jgi:hypothetical protein
MEFFIICLRTNNSIVENQLCQIFLMLQKNDIAAQALNRHLEFNEVDTDHLPQTIRTF